MKKILFMMVLLWVVKGNTVYAHCQIPCGIYDDNAMVVAMLEDVFTVEKSIGEMESLVDEKDIQSQKQMIRWVMNKEKHADNIISTISNYFLTQRVNEDQKDYEKRLIDHHKIIVLAMKVKQNSGIEYVEELKKAVEKLEKYYPGHKH